MMKIWLSPRGIINNTLIQAQFYQHHHLLSAPGWMMACNAQTLKQVMNHSYCECLHAQRVPNISAHWIASQDSFQLVIWFKRQILIYPC